MLNVLTSHGWSLSALGAAYLFVLANALGTALCYAAIRRYLIISPNRASGHYGLYVVVVLLSLLIATILDNTLVPVRSSALQYAAVPQIVLLMIAHALIYRRQEPRLIALGAASNAGAIATLLLASCVTDQVRDAHWVSGAALAALLAFLWTKSVSTQRAFVNAKSIYLNSKEGSDSPPDERPWLGPAHWAGLVFASLALATVNAMLQGARPSDVPAVAVLLGSAELIAATALIAAVPALSYWLARKHWMPELTRFVWLVWLVVGFSFSYGNYLHSFGH